MQSIEKSSEQRFIKAGHFEGYLEEVSCPVCVGEDNSRKKIYTMSSGVNIYLCEECRLMYASPRFTEKSLLEIYENEAFGDNSFYDNFTYERWQREKDYSYVTSSLKVDLVKKYVKEGSRVLDIGFATGLFVLEASRQNLKVEGIDSSTMLTQVGIKAHNSNITKISYEEFKPSYLFDAIVIWDVLEHVYDPIGLMNRAYDLLAPGGYLFIQVPNYRGFSNRFKSFLTRAGIKKSDYKHFGFPHHIFSFDRDSLTSIYNKTGFDVLLYESWSQKMKEGSLNFITEFIRKRALSDYIICVGQKNINLK